MKNYLITAAAGLVLVAGIGVAAAEDVVVVAPEQRVVVAPEQQTVIREYVHKQHLASISLLGVELNVGSALPDTVELHSIDVPDVKYKYVVVGDHAVLVDPASRRIVQVIE
ncbi:DUF1236 domain-containing protein [Mesorhizobium sp. AR07]|uniref:DUF1236 domain-containing protein n=1 Tax=Mesorhizobium sp. AR07 TaxID=2865838 RepID=UPI00215FF327|nr:DUF1236 domain-containing protein [Mesorhizobium sp. AR07]UVK46633.1 DUF1236 domain-containing protein [Mesorhizobium sp. AR07]